MYVWNIRYTSVFVYFSVSEYVQATIHVVHVEYVSACVIDDAWLRWCISGYVIVYTPKQSFLSNMYQCLYARGRIDEDALYVSLRIQIYTSCPSFLSA